MPTGENNSTDSKPSSLAQAAVREISDEGVAGEGETGGSDTASKAPGLRAFSDRLRPFGWLLRSGLNFGLVIAAIALGLFLLGYAQRSGWVTTSGGRDAGAAGDSSSSVEVKRFICPMMCVPPTTQPGRCPVCGMELVEAAAGGGGDGISVVIEPAARRLIGIRTEMAKSQSVTRTIQSIGSIEYDESQLATISAYVDGRLEKLYADYVGVPVSEGDDLALIYSPELYSAQAEFLSAMTSSSTSRFIDSSSMLEMATEKLKELGMSSEQIFALRESGSPESRIRIKSPQQGTVIEKLAVEGDYVKTGQAIYRVADLSTVWMMLELFPDDSALVRFGQEVEAEISSAPGVVFTGRIAFIDPTINRKTRSVRVRVEMLNLDGKLRPGDYATARIIVPSVPQDLTYDPALAGKFISPMHPQIIRDAPGICPVCDMELIPTSQLGFSAEPLPEHQVVTVPRNALLMAGKNSVVYVETEPGRFEVRNVALGGLTEALAIVSQGVAAGETVATEGNFLLDSQSQLAGNPSLLDPTKAPKFAPGPLQIQASQPIMLTGMAATAFDRGLAAYFEIQVAFAADTTATPASVGSLVENLSAVVLANDVPDDVKIEVQSARAAAQRLSGPLDSARIAFRTVSHALLRATAVARGPETRNRLIHYYCPMVPGGGGDWLQPGDALKNPYWGSEMLECGETVKDLSLDALPEATSPSMESTEDDDPFEGMEVQSLDFGN